MDNVRKLLSSEKINERKKGKALLLDFLKEDEVFAICTDKQWTLLISAAVDWEEKEIREEERKGKLPDIENAVFFRNFLKHGIGWCKISECMVEMLFFHSLTILHTPKLYQKYKEEHKGVICDLMNSFKISQSISPQLISDIVNATKLEVDFSTRSSLKLIRSSCLILFRDCALTELLEILLNWYIEVLSISISDSTAHNQVVVQLSECIVLLYEYQGPNLAYYFLHVFESLAKKELSDRILHRSTEYLLW